MNSDSSSWRQASLHGSSQHFKASDSTLSSSGQDARGKMRLVSVESTGLVSMDITPSTSESVAGGRHILLRYSRGNASTQPTFGYFPREAIDTLVNSVCREEPGSERTESLLRKLFLRYADEAVTVLTEYCSRSSMPIEVIEGIASVLSRFGGTTLETHSLQVLLALLGSTRAAVRESALMALDLLQDKRASDAIRRAMNVEATAWLRNLYRPVLEGLEAARGGL